MPELETLDGQVVTPSSDAPPGGQDEQAPPPRTPPADSAPGGAPRTKRAYNRRTPKPEQARVTRAAPVTLDDKQRADGVKGGVQIGAGLLLLAAKASSKDEARADAFKADAVTVANNGDELAGACVQLARNDPKFAAALDRVCAAGPYAALITIAVGVGSQVARNHKPALKLPGTVPPGDLLEQIREKETADA
jgi:hypothetical protein